MVAINQIRQPRSNQLGSRTQRSASNRSWHLNKRSDSSSDALIVSQQATEFFVANDPLTFGERIINCGPLPGKRPVVQGLMWAQLVILNYHPLKQVGLKVS